MNTDRSDGERALRSWFHDGPTAMPDRVIDVVADRIGHEPQRSRWRLQGRPDMTMPLKVAASLAAVLVVAVVAWQFLPADGGPGEPTAVPSPTATSPTATPTASPAPTGTVDLPDGPLSGGSYRIQPFFFMPDPSALSIVADIPAGWTGHSSVAAITKPDENTGVLMGFMRTDTLFSDGCHWDLDGSQSPDQAGDVVVGPSVDDLVAALRANSSYTSSAPTPLTIGGYEGQELELQLPGTDVIATCDNREGQSIGDFFVFPSGFYAQSTDSRWNLSIVDVDGTRLIILISIAPTASQADIAAARAIVESFQITP